MEGLANRGYTDGFYQRHHSQETQNYLRGHSESARSQYVGDIEQVDTANGMVEVAVKNRFVVGDRLEIVHPEGNRVIQLETMEDLSGNPITAAPGSGHRVRIPLTGNVEKAFVARFL